MANAIGAARQLYLNAWAIERLTPALVVAAAEVPR
jgi:hypothetical protein